MEFALVLPLLLLLVLGAIDWGYFFFVEQVVVNASREGARAGSLQYIDDSLAEAEALSAARDYLARGGLDGAKATVAVTLTEDSVRVVVDYPAGSLTGYLPIAVPASAYSLAEMRR
jgi:Flp pilus assembly protein TadG